MNIQGPVNVQNVDYGGNVTIESGVASGLTAIGSSFGAVTMDAFDDAVLILDGCGISSLELNGGAARQVVRIDNVVMVGGQITVDGAFTNGINIDNLTCRPISSVDILFTGVPNLDVDMSVIGGRSVIFEDCIGGTVNLRSVDARQHALIIDGSESVRFEGSITNAGIQTNNTYDGVVVTGAAERNRTEFTVTYSGSGNQMRNGMSIDSGVNDHVEASILTGSGATADFADAGTGTVLTDDHIV